MTRRAAVVTIVLAIAPPTILTSMRTWSAHGAAASVQLPAAGSIRGVWRLVSRTIPAGTAPGVRVDPFAHVPVGVQRDPQPGLLIFTARHFSRTTDTATAPRPTAEYATPRRPTIEELMARFALFAANAGTYDVERDVVTLHVIVANDARAQRPGSFARLRVERDGDRLSLTPIANAAGPIAQGVTSTYVRVE